MGRNPIDAETLKAEIERLPDLGLNELRARWKKLYGRPAPKFFRRKLLVRAVAYQMQVEAYGGLSPATKRGLREIAAAVRAGNEEAVIPAADQARHTALPQLAGQDLLRPGPAGRVRVAGVLARIFCPPSPRRSPARIGTASLSLASSAGRPRTGMRPARAGRMRQHRRGREADAKDRARAAGTTHVRDRARPKTLRCAIYSRK